MRLFRRFWSYLDVISITFNVVASLSNLSDANPINTRVIEALLIIIMFLKLLYYLRLIPAVAPLVSIMTQIVVDISWFMMIFIIFLIALILAFYEIGKNQEELQVINGTDRFDVPYATFLSSFNHVYTSSLGELDTETYYEDEMQPVLLILFIFMSFFMTIHLLNMLIAMMGESFAKNNEEGETKKKMSHLEFVVNNWYLDPIKEKERIVYIIAAKAVEGSDDTDERFDALESMMERVLIHQENLISEVKGIVNQLTIMRSTHKPHH